MDIKSTFEKRRVRMLKEMQEIRATIAGLEEKYNIKVIRVNHQDNSMLLRSPEGFGNLPTDNKLVDEDSYEKYICHTILVDGTKIEYLESREEDNDND